MWETVEASSDLIVNCAAGLGFRVLAGKLYTRTTFSQAKRSEGLGPCIQLAHPLPRSPKKLIHLMACSANLPHRV